jgi:glycosyltransferase involved in cell wall biosynthesis
LKVLFVASGNSFNFLVAPFIKAQGDSLKAKGIYLEYFLITEKGIPGYIKAAFRLRRFLKDNPVDIIHAHYTLSGWSAVLAFPEQPIVLSLMGSDAYGEYVDVNKISFDSRLSILLTWLIQFFVKSIICKSKHIESFVFLKDKSHVIPNGIVMEKINCQKVDFRKKLGLDPDKKYVLFLGNPLNIRKNFALAEKAVKLLGSDVELLAPYPVTHNKVIEYLKSVDVLIVPSLMEGSPNVVKEAMACNCPVVATDVGDIIWLFGNEPGHYLCGFHPDDVADKLKLAFNFSKKHHVTKGRNRLLKLGLNADNVAVKILKLYEKTTW